LKYLAELKSLYDGILAHQMILIALSNGAVCTIDIYLMMCMVFSEVKLRISGKPKPSLSTL
jgi:hypothetical protein